MKTYYRYFKAGGNFLFLSIILVFLLAAEVSFEFTVRVSSRGGGELGLLLHVALLEDD